MFAQSLISTCSVPVMTPLESTAKRLRRHETFAPFALASLPPPSAVPPTVPHFGAVPLMSAS